MRTDGELVVAAASGDRGAWDDLVGRHANLVYANARAVGADAATANDIAQVVWIRLLNRLDTIREPERIRGWLAIVARNATREHLRRQRPTSDLDRVLQRADEAMPGPEESAVRNEQSSMVRAALTALSEKCRELLTLLYSAEMSYDEISEATGMAIGSIGPTRQRCLTRLRGILEQGAPA